MDLKKYINKSQRLFIELGTPLLLEPDDPQKAVSCELIGMQVGKYLIVRLSTGSSGIDCEKNNDTFMVKYLCSGDVFGFSSRIIRNIDEPDQLLFIEYPKTVDSCNVRANERVACFLPVQISVGEITVKATVININLNGCLCVVESYPDPAPVDQDHVVVKFPYAGSNLLSVQGEVRSIKKQPVRLSIGIRFADMDNFSRSILGALIPAMTL